MRSGIGACRGGRQSRVPTHCTVRTVPLQPGVVMLLGPQRTTLLQTIIASETGKVAAAQSRTQALRGVRIERGPVVCVSWELGGEIVHAVPGGGTGLIAGVNRRVLRQAGTHITAQVRTVVVRIHHLAHFAAHLSDSP